MSMPLPAAVALSSINTAAQLDVARRELLSCERALARQEDFLSELRRKLKLGEAEAIMLGREVMRARKTVALWKKAIGAERGAGRGGAA